MNKIKKFLFCTLFFATQTLVFAQKNNEIRVQIDGYNAGTARLVGFWGDQNFQLDTARISPTGSVVLERANSYPSGLYFLLLPDKQQVQFLIDSARQTPIVLHTQREQLLDAMQIPPQDVDNTLLYNNLRFQKVWQPQMEAAQRALTKTNMAAANMDYPNAKKEVDALQTQLDDELAPLKTKYAKTFFAAFKIAGQNPKVQNIRRADGSPNGEAQRFAYRTELWDNTDFGDVRLLATPVIANKLRLYIKDLTAQQPDSIIAAADFLVDKILREKGDKEIFKFVLNYIALQYKPAHTSLMDGEAVYSHLILKYFTPKRAFWSNAKELDNLRGEAQKMRASIVGVIGQDVRGYDVTGKPRTLYDMAARVKILFIYNPDCEHCQAETPILRQFYDQWKARGVEVFSIASMATDNAQWQGFVKKYGVNWTDVVDYRLESHYNDKYFTDITPEIYVLDANNRIVAKNLKAAQLEEVIAPMLK